MGHMSESRRQSSGNIKNDIFGIKMKEKYSCNNDLMCLTTI